MTGLRGVTGLQNALATTLQATVDVYRKTIVSDSAGGQVDTYTKHATLACSYGPSPAIPRERESTTQLQSHQYWIFSFAHGTDVRPTDRLVVGTRTFEVSGGGTSSLNIFAQFTCVEIL